MLAKNGTVYVDNTTLRATAQCESEVALRHVLGYTVLGEEAYALECGTATHEVMADYFKGKSAEYCLQKYELLYHGYSEDQGLDHPEHPAYRLSWTNTDKILKEWFETHPLDGFSFRVNPELVEVGFEVPLSDECVCGHDEPLHSRLGGQPRCLFEGCSCQAYRPAFVMWGRLDAIVQSQHDGSIYVLDHKTTGRLTPYWTEKFRMDSQMSGYTWAAQKTLGMPVVGVYINAIEYSKLPDSSRKCTNHGVPYSECGPLHMKSELLIYTRSPDQLEEWRLSAIQLARKYRELHRTIPDLATALTNTRMEGTFTGACGFCTFNKFCQANRPPHYASSMLVHQPWRPYPKEES